MNIDVNSTPCSHKRLCSIYLVDDMSSQHAKSLSRLKIAKHMIVSLMTRRGVYSLLCSAEEHV